ncbi:MULTISPECIES: hypothetical protein [unclassified Parafrankia]|uniref:hypothetical protein n=1 Tax=unclassified Parafrankia TaxID=2994368 RepID=UPI000DA5B67C|nr:MULTISPECIES: hypothetical protein [unclassified Parafrankia]TCJ34504.1 hypothetical protein E0504_32690 [Parafrankia sp. BMG5.11]SQD93370.1 conserved exported hypothetical protein [Parafrankia sp. Ea1.12]SQD99992.1 conserved exported hypothetical protein [Parafrankia sp. Ea1.12]
MLRPRVRLASTRAALLLAALAGTLALAVGVAPVAGAASTTSHGGGYSPVGYWTGTATTALGATESVQMLFLPKSRFAVATPSGTFWGSWHSTGSKTFTYSFVRTLPGPNGTVVGSIDIRHSATFSSRDAFSSTGTATGYDLNGNVLFSGPVTSTATR